jgi:hypothetical protein
VADRTHHMSSADELRESQPSDRTAHGAVRVDLIAIGARMQKLGTIWVIVLLYLMVGQLFRWRVEGNTYDEEGWLIGPTFLPWEMLCIYGGVCALNLAAALCGRRVRRTRSRAAAVAGGLICIVPGLSPMLVVGIPNGVRALIAARRARKHE